jgi:hypothetical protein
MENMNCGNPTHDNECLCDVVLTGTTPINVDAVYGMWMGPELCEYRQYKQWTNDSMLDYLQDLVYLHDMHKASETASIPEELRPAKGATSIHPCRTIRVNVRRALSQEPTPPIREVLESMGISAERFTEAVSMGAWEMDMEKLERFEHAILHDKRTLISLSKEFGIGPDSIKKFRAYWSNHVAPVIPRGAGTLPHQVRMHQLIGAGLRPREIVKVIADEFGVTISSSAVSQAKRRRVTVTKVQRDTLSGSGGNK